MRFSLVALLIIPSLASTVCVAFAQQKTLTTENPTVNYPNKVIRLIAAAAPGGGMDIVARFTAQRLLGSLPQAVVVDNRGGSGGLIGAEITAKSAPDGYTLLINGPGGSYFSALYKKLSFDPDHDLAPVIQIARQPYALTLHPSVPANSIAEFVQLAKNKPGQLRYGNGGLGSASHMAVELLRSAAKIDIVNVPYKGTGPATLALLSGEMQFLMVGVATIAPHANTGKVKLLAVTTSARTSLLPALPTISESGIPGYSFAVWYGMFAPAKTPRAIVNKLSAEINRGLQQPELRERFTAEGLEVVGGTPEQFEAHFRAEIIKWKKVVQEAGIRAE